MQKIRIVSDGIGVGTRVIDLATGTEIGFVQEIDIRIRPAEAVTAMIKIKCTELDIISDAEITQEVKEEENVEEKEIESEPEI